MSELSDFLQQRAQQGLLRRLIPAERRDKGLRYCQGEEPVIDFSSNDYLGFSHHPRIKAAMKEAIDRFGVGSSASRLLSGDLSIFHELEQKVSRLKKKEGALIFNSGYQANVGILSALYKKGDVFFSDKINHASIIDGMRLSGADFFRFRHNDIDHLEQLLKLKRADFKQALIITETIFSMDGDKPDLNRLVKLKEKYDCLLFVDEAHATGIFGRDGAGVVEELGLTEKVDFIMGTFSKALGSFGAYLAASAETVDYLINQSRGFIYSTALPPALIAADIAALSCLKDEPDRRRVLLANADYLRNRLKSIGLETLGESQIVPIVIGDSAKAVSISEELAKRRFWVCPIRPPTVPANSARLRVSLSYDHGRDTIDKFVEEINKLV